MACSAVSVVLMCVLTMRVVISNDKKEDLLNIVVPVMRCSNISTLSMTLTDNGGNKVYMKGYEIDAHGQIKSVSGKIFCVGGATRAFTAVLLAKLLSKHPNITWDTPIRDIVNDRIDLPYQYLANNLNLKDIFTMRSGLAGLDIVPVAKPYSVDELIRNLRYAPPVAGFREKFIYNEVLFSLLEKVVYVLGNDTWQNLIKHHIFMPLQMTSTAFLGPDTYHKPNFVKGSVRYNDGSENLDAESYSGLELIAPAASVCTTEEEMHKWFNFLLNGGKVRDRVIVEKAALEETYSAIQSRGKDADPVVPGDSNPSFQVHYSRHSNAIGWISGIFRDFPFVSQDGSIPGYQSLATIVPSRKIAVYVAFSGDHDVTRYAAKVLLNQLGIDYLTREKAQNAAEICAIIRKVTEINKKPRKPGVHISRNDAKAPPPLEDYVGIYRNYAYGDIHVKTSVDSSAGESGLTLQYGLTEYTLYSTSQNNTFQLIVRKGSLWYSTNADWYRLNQEIFAEFISDSQEQDQKFTSVRIDGFDRHYIPEFSRNAREPHYEGYTDDHRCSAPVLTAWQWGILLVITVMHFS